MFELESIALSLVLLPFIIALFWYASDFLPRNLRIVTTLASSLIGWRVLITFFLEPLLYMFGLTVLTLILVLLVAILLSLISKLMRRKRVESKILNYATKYELSPLARQILEMLLENPRGVSFPELLRIAGPAELRAALEELKSQGIVVESSGLYRLRGLSPVREL